MDRRNWVRTRKTPDTLLLFSKRQGGPFDPCDRLARQAVADRPLNGFPSVVMPYKGVPRP